MPAKPQIERAPRMPRPGPEVIWRARLNRIGHAHVGVGATQTLCLIPAVGPDESWTMERRCPSCLRRVDEL